MEWKYRPDANLVTEPLEVTWFCFVGICGVKQLNFQIQYAVVQKMKPINYYCYSVEDNMTAWYLSNFDADLW